MTPQPIDIRGGWTSASNAQADALCPGRHIAQRGIPDKEGEFAAIGNRIDAALFKRDPTGLSLEESDTYDACLEIESRKLAEFFGTDAAKAKSWRKERYWLRFDKLDEPVQHCEHSGEADQVYRFGSKAMILDWKALFGDVAESPANMQLRDLAVLVKCHFLTVSEIAVAIIQPRVSRNPEVCLYDQAAIDRAAVELRVRVAASNDPRSPRVAGEKQCLYCKAKTTCVEFSRWSGTMIPVPDAGPIAMVAKQELFETAMASWSPDQRSFAASILSPAGKRLDEIKEFLKDGLGRDPGFVPGYELSPGNKRETITDPQACFDRFAAIGGKLVDFMSTVSVGKTKLKEAVNVVTGARGKALDNAIKTLTEGIVDETRNAHTIRKVSDK